MYGQSTSQEIEHKSFFYPKETMGTTILALKYDGGVIACADSRILCPTQELRLAAPTLSIELPTKLILSMTTSSFCEVD